MPRYYDAEGRSYGDVERGKFSRFKPIGKPPKDYSHFRQKDRNRLEDPKVPYFLAIVTIIDIALFIWSLVENGGFAPFRENPLGGPSVQTLVNVGAKYGPCIREGQWWRFISPIFLHVGIVHILLNLFMQVRVGFDIERCYGALRIAPVYLGAGVMGNLLSAIFLPNIPSVGASSSLFGLVALMLVDLIIHWNSLKYPACALCEYICQLVFILLLGMLPAIDNFAHIGGYIGGMLLAIIFIPGTRHICPEPEDSCFESCSWMTCKLLMVVVVSAGTVVLYVGLFSSFYAGVDSDGWCPGCEVINCLPVLDWCNSGEQIYQC